MHGLAETLFTTERVRAILGDLLERQASRSDDHAHRITALHNKVADAEGRLSRLYQAIETGIADFADPTLKERVAALDRVVAELRPETRITEERIAVFASLMRENVKNRPVPFRRAWLRAVIDQVEVDDAEVRIHGRRDVLERLVMSGGASPAGVPSFCTEIVHRLQRIGEHLPH